MPMPKGSKLSPEHRRRIGEGVKNSERYRIGMKNRKLINPFKGHNYGECKKCGKTHIHPMKGKHHSEESKLKIGNANRGKKLTLEHRLKLSEALRGRKGIWKGKHFSVEHKLNIAKGVRNSKIHRDRLREYWRQRACESEEEVKAFLRTLYGLGENVVFFPASKYEHQFSRRVLIEHSHYYGFITQSGLRAIPDWFKGEMVSEC